MPLDDLRKKIDSLDSELLRLLNERAEVVHGIGEAKKQAGLMIYAPEREEALSSMRGLCAEGRPVVVIATPQVAGAGLNMQALSAVVVVGLYWAVQELQQTVARVHRIGQTRGCLCIALVTGQEDQTLLDIMQEKMHSTAAYYGDKSGLMLPRDHVERLGVCEVEAVGGIVEEVRACLEEGTAGPPSDRGAAKWPLLCKGA